MARHEPPLRLLQGDESDLFESYNIALRAAVRERCLASEAIIEDACSYAWEELLRRQLLLAADRRASRSVATARSHRPRTAESRPRALPPGRHRRPADHRLGPRAGRRHPIVASSPSAHRDAPRAPSPPQGHLRIALRQRPLDPQGPRPRPTPPRRRPRRRLTHPLHGSGGPHHQDRHTPAFCECARGWMEVLVD
jgi:hypothetical protein